MPPVDPLERDTRARADLKRLGAALARPLPGGPALHEAIADARRGALDVNEPGGAERLRAAVARLRKRADEDVEALQDLRATCDAAIAAIEALRIHALVNAKRRHRF